MSVEELTRAAYAKALADASTELVDSDDIPMWFRCDTYTREQARSAVAFDYGVRMVDVRCRKTWCRPDEDAMREAADDLVHDHPDATELPDPSYDGWRFMECAKDAPDAIAYWRCEEPS